MNNTILPVFPMPGSKEYEGLVYAYEQLANPVALVNADSQPFYLNRAARDFLGCFTPAAIGTRFGDFWCGRLRPVDAPGGALSSGDTASYFEDHETTRVYVLNVTDLPNIDGTSVRLEILQDVTTLYEGDERVKTMIDAAPLCCNYWNDRMENIDCNLEAAKLFDLPDKKAYLERFAELSPEVQPNGRKSSAEAERHISIAFRDGFERFEWMHQKLNGEQVPAEITLVKVHNRKGDVVLGYTRDLRSARQVSDVDDIEWIMHIFNSLPFPVGVANATGKWMFMNKAGLDMLGVEGVGDLAGVSSSDWGGRLEPLPTNDAEVIPHFFDQTEGRIYRRTDSPLKDSFGGLVGRVETLQDVTSQYESEERIRAMIDAAPLCCNFWNSNFENIDCNLEAAKLFDLPDKKAYLDHFFELSPEFQPNGEPSADEARRHIAKALQDGLDRFKWMHQKLNGEPVPSEITLVRVNLRDQNVVLGYTRDLRITTK